MRVRVESPYSISAGLFKPIRTRRIASVGHTVHWYQIGYRDLDTFLREIYHYYHYNHYQQQRNRDQYQWYCSLTVYYRSMTIDLNLSNSRLYHNPEYRLQFRRELSGDFGFRPESIEFWECDTERNPYLFSDIREFLKNMVKGVTK